MIQTHCCEPYSNHRKRNRFGIAFRLVVVLTGFPAVVPRLYAGTGESVPAQAVEMLFPDRKAAKDNSGNSDISKTLSGLQKSLRASEKRLQIVEERLGSTPRRPTLSSSIERRLENVEQRLDRIERDIDRLDALEQRIRKLEMKR